MAKKQKNLVGIPSDLASQVAALQAKQAEVSLAEQKLKEVTDEANALFSHLVTQTLGLPGQFKYSDLMSAIIKKLSS